MVKIPIEVRWKENSRHAGKASVVFQALEDIRSESGTLDPHIVVERAKAKTNPLHKFFTWNNGEAADKWRVHEARNLINSIEIVREKTDSKPQQIYPAFVANPESPGYLDTADALSHEGIGDAIIDSALAGLNGWKDRYGRLTALKSVVDAIDVAIAERRKQKEGRSKAG